MKFSIRKSANHPIYGCDVWEVLKKFDHPNSDDLLIATYPNGVLARWCLAAFHTSMEVTRNGGSVESPPREVEVKREIDLTTPDELIW